MAESAIVPGEMKRRDFFGAAGAGLFVFFGADMAEGQEPGRLPGGKAVRRISTPI